MARAPTAVVTPAVPPGTTVVIRRRSMHVALARWSTIWLIIFMLAVPFFGQFDPTGAFTHFLKDWLFIAFVAYMAVQFWETANRASVDRSGFFEDNGLALVAVIIGIGVFVLLFSRTIRLTQDQIHIMLQCTLWGGLDFVFGVLISQRIAASAKERDEE